VNSLPKTVNRQRRGCDLNPGPSVPESSTLTTRLTSHCASATESIMPHRCCQLLNEVDNVDQMPHVSCASQWLGNYLYKLPLFR